MLSSATFEMVRDVGSFSRPKAGFQSESLYRIFIMSVMIIIMIAKLTARQLKMNTVLVVPKNWKK